MRQSLKWLIGEIRKRGDIETRFFDAVDFVVPQDDRNGDLPMVRELGLAVTFHDLNFPRKTFSEDGTPFGFRV